MFWLGQLVGEVINEAKRLSKLKWGDWPDVLLVVNVKLNAKLMTK